MQLNMVVHRVFHAQKNWVRPKMTEIGFSPGQPKVLNYIYYHDRCMQREVADALDIEPATVSRILNNMVKSGLVERSALAPRKRAESLSVTEKGAELFEKWKTLCSEYELMALQGFSEAERLQLAGFLGRVYQNITGKTLE